MLALAEGEWVVPLVVPCRHRRLWSCRRIQAGSRKPRDGADRAIRSVGDIRLLRDGSRCGIDMLVAGDSVEPVHREWLLTPRPLAALPKADMVGDSRLVFAALSRLPALS